MITYETDELKKSNRKKVNTAKKKGSIAKIYTVNIERKRLLKQRREKTLQNTKGKRLAEEKELATKVIKPQRIHIRERKTIMGRSMMITQIWQ